MEKELTDYQIGEGIAQELLTYFAYGVFETSNRIPSGEGLDGFMTRLNEGLVQLSERYAIALSEYHKALAAKQTKKDLLN